MQKCQFPNLDLTTAGFTQFRVFGGPLGPWDDLTSKSFKHKLFLEI